MRERKRERSKRKKERKAEKEEEKEEEEVKEEKRRGQERRIRSKFCSLMASGITRYKTSLGSNWSRWSEWNGDHVYMIPVILMKTHL